MGCTTSLWRRSPGDPFTARTLATAFAVVVDRFGDVMYHAELVVLVAIMSLRTGNAPLALSYLETAKRAPMIFPFWYRIVSNYASLARTAIGHEELVAAAVQRARTLSVEMVLDLELRRASS